LITIQGIKMLSVPEFSHKGCASPRQHPCWMSSQVYHSHHSETDEIQQKIITVMHWGKTRSIAKCGQKHNWIQKRGSQIKFTNLQHPLQILVIIRINSLYVMVCHLCTKNMLVERPSKVNIQKLPIKQCLGNLQAHKQ